MSNSELEHIKKRLTDILLRYDIYMDGVFPQGDHNHMADSLTLEVEKMLREQVDLLERAYKLLQAISEPFTTVERYDVEKWLKDARQAGIGKTSEKELSS